MNTIKQLLKQPGLTQSELTTCLELPGEDNIRTLSGSAILEEKALQPPKTESRLEKKRKPVNKDLPAFCIDYCKGKITNAVYKQSSLERKLGINGGALPGVSLGAFPDRKTMQC